MLQDWTDEQLNLGIAVMSVLTFLALLIILALWVSPSIASPIGLAPIPPTSTPRPAATLPPTWTPNPTETASPTRTPRPTETLAPTQTGTPTATATPDVGATLTALPTNTATTVPPSPPPIEEPPPVSGGNGGGGSSGGGSTAPPPPPTATPIPLYTLTDLRGGASCDWVGFFGYVYNADGRPRPNTNVRVFNEFGFEQTVTTRNDGFWEVFLDGQPRADLAGSWHLVVLEGGERASNEIVVLMGPDCTSGRPTRFKADWQRSVP